MKTARNSRPFALWSVISVTRLCSPRMRVLVGEERDLLQEAGEARLVRGCLVLLGHADELLEVLDPALRLDRALGLERVEVAGALEHALDELGHGQLQRAGHQRLEQRAEALDGA